MKKLLLGLIPAIITLAIIAWPYAFTERISFEPQWRVGQSWKIQVFSRRAEDGSAGVYHNIWKFKVTGKQESGGRPFYTVETKEEGKKTGLSYRFVLAPEMVLSSISVYRDGKRQRMEAPDAKVFFLNGGEPSILPLDFSPLPIVRLGRNEMSSAVTKRQLHAFAPADQLIEFSQEIPVEQPVRHLVVLTSIKTDGGVLESLQQWEEDKLWWSGARRTRNGIIECEAILID